MKNIRNVLWGVILVVVGVIIACNSLGLTNIDILFKGWWTLFIIVPCFINLFNDNDKTGSLIGILIGVMLLLGSRGIINFDMIWKLILPIIIIIVGLSLIFKDLFNSEISKKISSLNKNNNNESCCATFSGQKLNFGNKKFTGANLDAIFGGVEYDLRDAKITSDVVINTSSIFGGIDIFVPDDVNVEVRSTSIFGGVDNKKKATSSEDKKYTVYINAFCIFGGVDIK